MRKTDACLFGATTTPVGVPGYKSAIVGLRKKFDLYANLRPIKSYSIPTSISKNVDLIIVRENTEGMYSGIEYTVENTAFAIRVVSQKASQRIAKTAFNLAHERKQKLTMVTKANILRESCGLFRKTVFEVAKDFPDVEVTELFVDAIAMKLIRNPSEFDVILTTNLFGDILSDEAAGLIGGLGLAPSGCIGDNFGLFEPVHGSGTKMIEEGRGQQANPIATILSASMMLKYLNEFEWANKINQSIENVLNKNDMLTSDLGGNATVNQITDCIIQEMNNDS